VVRFILPIKELRRGKTRLHVPHRPALVEAMLLDTLEAVLDADAGPVVLVSPDPRVAQIADEYAVALVTRGGALNEAVSAALGPGRCAAVLPDLPALRADDIRSLVNAERGFVPDAAGTGTTMAIAENLLPVFGPGSARAFESQGLTRLAAAPTARCDVDDTKALSMAVMLGLGRHTKTVLNHEGPAHTTWTGPS
jgi:2-phospho-L-lactate guanylyltransferase